jgi:hypothetical protein
MNSEIFFKTYIITFGLFDTDNKVSTAVEGIRNYLVSSNDILGYWNYIPLVYCVKTKLSSSELRVAFSMLTSVNLMIAEINPNNVDGHLPQAAWDWFYSPPEKPLLLDPNYSSNDRGFSAPAPKQLKSLGDLF